MTAKQRMSLANQIANSSDKNMGSVGEHLKRKNLVL